MTITLVSAPAPVAAAGGTVPGGVFVPGAKILYEIEVSCGSTQSYIIVEGQFSSSWWMPYSRGLVTIGHYDDYCGRSVGYLDDDSHWGSGSSTLYSASVGAGSGSAVVQVWLTNCFAMFDLNIWGFVLSRPIITYGRLTEYEDALRTSLFLLSLWMMLG